MKKVVERLMSGATRLLVLALGLGLATTCWAVAPTPTAVWDRNFVDNSVTRGEDGYDYTFTLNDPNNTVSDGILKIGSTDKRGALISIGDSTASKVSVLVKYAFAKAPTESALPLVIYTDRGSSANSPDVGLVSTGGNSTMLWPCWVVKSGSVGYNNVNVGNLNRQSGYMLLSYDCSTLKCYVGSSIASLSGITQAYTWAGKVTHVGLGGPTGKAHDTSGTNNDHYPAWNGLVIEKVALFVGESYSNTEVSEYIFPGEATYYSQWDYANDIITWTTGSSGNKDMGGNATFALFDKNTGTDTATVYTGGSTSPAYGTSTQKFWYNLSCASVSTSYKAPGLVLRVANNLATLSMGGSFGPLTLGGMIVEPGAYDNSLSTYNMNQDPSNSNRSTILGDPTGNAETLFDFNESFAINRGGAFCFPGKVNLNIHTGKSLTLSQAAKICESVTGVSDNGILEDSMFNAGGTLKMHGNGTLVASAGLNASGASLDFSDLAGRVNDTPFINGALTIDANTTFILPASATSPYKVAASVTGTYPTSITIGDKTYMATLANGENAGEIAWEVNEYTIDVAGDDYVFSTIFPDPASTKDYSLKVEQDATLNVGSSTVRAITIDVAEGKTLTLSGTSLAATTIYVTGKGTVKVTTAGALQGTLRGDGTVTYSAAPSGLTLNDAAWEGVLWLKNVEIVGLVPGNVTSANSTLRLTGCTGYFNNSGTASNNPQSTDGTLDLQDDGSTKAFTVSNGWSDNGITVFGKLTGTGTLACSTADISQRYVFKNAAQFTGTINTERMDSAGSYYLRVILGDGASLAPRSGTITVASDATATVTAGKTWNAWAINVNGTLNVGNGSTVPAINTGSTGAIIAPSGTATISGVQGNAISAGLGMIGGTIAVSGATSLTELTIPSDTTQATPTFFALGGGKLDLSACTSLTTLKLNLGSSTSFDLGNVILPASCTTVKYVVAAGSLRDLSAYTAPTGLGSLTWASEFVLTETRYEYANGTFSVSNVPANASVTVTRPDGSSTAATVTDGTARLNDYGEPKVTGDACWHAYEFNNNWDDSVSVGAYECKTWNGNAPNFAEDSDKAGNYFVYTSIRPGPTDAGGRIAYSYPEEWSAAIRCTVPQTANGIIVCFGKVTNSAGLNQYIALVSGDTAGKVKLVHGAGGGKAEDIAEMTVANPTTSQHVYVFTKTATTVTVYCDGDLITSKAVSASPYNAFQFGTQYGGMQSGSGLSAVTDKATGGMVDYTRLYDFAISDDMIQKLAQDDPYDSSTPTYSREVSGSPWWYTGEGTWLKSDDSTLVGVPDVAGIVDLTATADATMTVNLPAAPVYEKLTFQGAGAVTLVKNGSSPKIATAKLVVKTNVTAPYDIADFSGARVSVDAGKVLTFDFSTYPLESVTGVTTQQVTGVTTRADDRYAVVASAKSAWNSNLSLVYDPVEYVYSVVIAPAALVTKNNTTVAYPTVAAALTALSTDAGTIRLLVDYDQDITLSAGQTLDAGSTTYSGTASPTGAYVELVRSGTTWKAVDNSVNTWKSSVTTGEWNTVANWENGVKPKSYTRVIFPKNDDPGFTGYTVGMRLNGNSFTSNTPVCTGMVVNAKVDMIQGENSGSWGAVELYGDVSGEGTLALHKIGLYNALGSSTPITVSCGLSVAIKSATYDDCHFEHGPFVFDGAVTATTNSYFKAMGAVTFNGLVTIENGAKVEAYSSGTTTYNGGISVPADAAALLEGSSRVTIASTVTLASGATLTVPNVASTSGATFATSVADSYVKATAGESTTVYSVAAKRTATVSVGTNASLSINDNAVADGDTLKFVPGDVLTITASADTYYTPALTVNGFAQISPYELTTTDADVTVSVTATLDTYTITIPSVANTTVSVSYTSGGVSQTATTDGDITVDAGTILTATWTAVEGFRITAGASQTINAVTSAQELASPTVKANSVEFSNFTVEYLADFSKAATITATVTGDGAEGATYTITAGGEPITGTYSNGTVTFNDVDCPSIGGTLSYTISASGTTSGSSGAQTSPVGNVADGWVIEDSTHTGETGTGTWETPVTYSGTVATITNNTYTTTKAGDGIVTLTTVVKFGDDADPEVQVGTAQAALRVQNGVFEVYGKTTSEDTADWQTTSVDADSEATYRVVIVVNYTTDTFTMTVAKGEEAAQSLGETWYLATDADKVSQIAYKGTGEFTSLVGSFISSDIEVTVETADDVAVSGDFISRYLGGETISAATELLAPGSTTTASNGYNYFSNYALGLDPTDEEDKPTIKVETNSEGKFVVTLTDKEGNVLDIADNVAVTLSVKTGATPESVTGDGVDGEIVDGEGSAEWKSFVIDPSKVDSVKYYKVQVDIGAK